MQVCLVCVVHDIQGRYVNFVRQAAPILADLYSEMCIAVSDQTSGTLVAELQKGGFKTRIVPKAGAANARRDALRFAVGTPYRHFHYCDLDKALTWVLNDASELKEVQDDIDKHDYLIVGRTQQAFYSHPDSWVKTEEITNHIASLELGFEVDITAGSCGLSRHAVESILKHSVAQMTDAEWAMIVRRIAHGTVGYRAVRGLKYVEEVNGPLNDQLDSNSWLSRLRLSYIISQSAILTGKTGTQP